MTEETQDAIALKDLPREDLESLVVAMNEQMNDSPTNIVNNAPPDPKTVLEYVKVEMGGIAFELQSPKSTQKEMMDNIAVFYKELNLDYRNAVRVTPANPYV